MKSLGSTFAGVTKILGGAAVAALLLGSSGAVAQSEARPAAERAPVSVAEPTKLPMSREDWRKAMAKAPLPKNGCFTSSYPSTAWHEVACSAPPKLPSPPSHRGGSGFLPSNVGDGNGDYNAQASSGLITSAEGSLNSVNGASGVSGEVGGGPTYMSPFGSTAYPNVFMFQINTQRFPTATQNLPPPALCNNEPGCQGWQQFLYSQTLCSPAVGQQPVVSLTVSGITYEGAPCVYMEYWLLDYLQSPGQTCPTTPVQWTQSGTDCWFNGPSTSIPDQTVGDLAGLTMTATVSAGGQNKLTLATTSGPLYAVGQDSELGLANYWNAAEFNVFGDCCGSATNFTTPTTLVVKTSIDDGGTAKPSCNTESFTAETNNLTIASPGMPVCCPYDGSEPAIEFMETDAGHTATCGMSVLEGDPHITTADGTHYNFQGAGEFVSVRDRDGAEIQTRQEPVATASMGTDAHDGLSTCVSLNTAVAARVGEHRVSYEPNLSGVPDPSGLELRVDGILTALGAQGKALGHGGRVVPLAGGGLEVDFPDGKTMLVTPTWWAAEQKWYLNVDVTHVGLVSGGSQTSAHGITGAIIDGNWLPMLPNGASLGPMPASLHDRYVALYQTFADAWRVDAKDSLFDYAPGTSTDSFTIKDWPRETLPCEASYPIPVTGLRPLMPPRPRLPVSDAVAEEACRRVMDPNRHADCVFDVKVTGDSGFAKTDLLTEHVLAFSTATSLIDKIDASRPGDWVVFTAFVAPNASDAKVRPSGAVQFAVDGVPVGEPVKVDAKGRAVWKVSKREIDSKKVTASFVPDPDSAFLASTSLERIHQEP